MQDKRANWIHNDKNPTKDDLIVDQIKDQLEEKMQASSMDINLFCKDGFVHMYGIVDVLSEKIYAEEIARNIEGVRKIENKITVAMDSNITDKHMEKEVIDRLYKHDNLVSVGVKVDDGVATLIGTAHALKDAKEAYRLASEARGIKNVVNNIDIETKGKYVDSDIVSNITQKLNTTGLSLPDISYDVTNGKVTFKGYVNNKQEVELAKEIAMGIEGVTKVINKLKIRKNNKKK